MINKNALEKYCVHLTTYYTTLYFVTFINKQIKVEKKDRLKDCLLQSVAELLETQKC